MPINHNTPHADHKTSRHLAILVAVSIAIGIWFMSTTIISTDGVTFINYARELADNPRATMLQQDQHPGYPAMILLGYKASGLFSEADSLGRWVCSARIIALAGRVLAVVVLYFLAARFVSKKSAFWSILVLILLPKPARYGSDALSDWVHLLFVALGCLLVIRAFQSRRFILFVLAGAVCGLGYLVRPECVQVLVYAGAIAAVHLFMPAVPKGKILLGLVLTFVGFATIALPYMNFKGAIFPKKKVAVFDSPSSAAGQEPKQGVKPSAPEVIYMGKSESTKSQHTVFEAAAKLFSNFGETMMWFFTAPAVVGLIGFYRRTRILTIRAIFMTTALLLNVALMFWLFNKAGYMSMRHTLVLSVFILFFAADGLSAIARWLACKQKDQEHAAVISRQTAQNFIVLLIIGIAICMPKIVVPPRSSKNIYQKVGRWLAQNTTPAEMIAAPDPRLLFFAGRGGYVCDGTKPPAKAAYEVKVIKAEGPPQRSPLRKAAAAFSNHSYEIQVYKLNR